MKEAGIETDLTDEKIQQLIDSMADNQDSLASLQQSYADLYKSIGNLEQGSTIAAEDYEKLSDVGKTYFTQMLDGTFKLTSDAEKFYDLVHDEQVSKFQNRSKELSNENEQIRKVSNYDFDELSKSQNYVGSDGENYYNRENVQKQIDALRALGYEESQLNKWQDELIEKGKTTTGVLNDVAAAVASYGDTTDQLNQRLE